MTHTPPDWTKPETLELWNSETGETREVVPNKREWPDKDGSYGLHQNVGGYYYFDRYGSPGYTSPWRIRNKPEAAPAIPGELVERMVAAIGTAAKGYSIRLEARAIQAALDALNKPVDPLVEIMRALDGSWAAESTGKHLAATLRRELDKRGLAIGKGDAS